MGIKAAGMTGRLAAVAIAAIAMFAILAAAFAAPSFPALSGRVVDQANVLSPEAEAQLTQRLAALEASTGRQVVVVTLASLQGYEIEDYGYQLGRAWGIGRAREDDGALLIVAPNERRVRIEVGYGLEPLLTDALSSAILNRRVLPRFRAGDIEGGVVAGADAIIEQLALPAEEAEARAAEAGRDESAGLGLAQIILLFVGLLILSSLLGGARRRRGGWLGGGPIIIIPGGFSRRGGGFGRGGFGGGGFGGGGGSFGGGGASGRW
jgi:uncharacterized protein